MAREILDDAAWVRALDDPALRLSPTLAGFPRGRVRMAKDWDTEERILDVHLVYVCRRGGFEARLGGRWRTIAAGMVCLVPPGVAFRFQAGGAPVVARFRLAVERDGRPLAWGRSARTVAMDASLERLVDLLVDELHGGGDAALAADVARAFCRAFRRAETDGVTGGGGRGRLSGDQLAALAAEVARRPCATTARDLARHLALSPDWASRLIRSSTGLPPRAWIVRERIRLGSDLLTQGLPPAAVARRLGYRDPRLFGRQFRAVQGCPPGTWARRTRRE